MYHLKKETVKNLANVLGKPLNEIQNMNLSDEIAYVERKNRERLRFPETVDSRLMSTGDPLIATGRIRTMEDVDKYFDKLLFPRSLLWKVKKWFNRNSSKAI